MNEEESENPQPDGADSSMSGRIEDLWDSSDALESLKLERSLQPELSDGDLTRKLMEAAAPAAATSIIQLSMHATNENTRLNAAKYITDWLRDPDRDNSGVEGWEDMVADVVSKAQVLANSPQSSPGVDSGEGF